MLYVFMQSRLFGFSNLLEGNSSPCTFLTGFIKQPALCWFTWEGMMKNISHVSKAHDVSSGYAYFQSCVRPEDLDKVHIIGQKKSECALKVL